MVWDEEEESKGQWLQSKDRLWNTDIHGLKSESGPVLHIVGYSEQFYFSFCSLYVVIVLINILTDSLFLSAGYLIISYI